MSFSAEELPELSPSFEPFFPFGKASSDNSIDIFRSISGIQNDAEDTNTCSALFLEEGSGFKYSSSPPCQQLENLTLYGLNWSYLTEGPQTYDCLEGFKREKLESGQGYGDEAFVSRSYEGCDDFNKYMVQRNGFVDETRKISTFSNSWMDSSQNCFFGGKIRRVCSTGDLQFSRSTRARGSSPRAFSSLLAGETSINAGELNTKAIRCSAEERNKKILKYRAKRSQRNFNKTIKYVCRKKLADTRPRIRGRFAHNDKVGDPPKAAFLLNNDAEDGFWVGLGMHEDQEEFYGAGGDEGGGETCVSSQGPAEGRLRYYYNNLTA